MKELINPLEKIQLPTNQFHKDDAIAVLTQRKAVEPPPTGREADGCFARTEGLLPHIYQTAAILPGPDDIQALIDPQQAAQEAFELQQVSDTRRDAPPRYPRKGIPAVQIPAPENERAVGE
ncbi:MAG: hypothetical protein M3Q44_05315 [bacterium]|nr:hypothetical protein [bacterium]